MIGIHYTCAVDTDSEDPQLSVRSGSGIVVRDPDLGSEKPCYQYNKIGTGYQWVLLGYENSFCHRYYVYQGY
jgi:hypothetical protein